MRITVESPVEETPRVLQVRGIFDLAPSATSSMSWEVDLPLAERPWNLGLLVGPSGCGKSTIARRLWPDALAPQPTWPATRSILDGFPRELPIKELVELLSSVGFSSPPAWLRPFHVLSTGQQFRVTLAWLLAAAAPERLIVCDEFTSVVDRTVAQVGSAALAKTVRRRGQRFIALTCHEDVEEWLQPDWVYRPAEQRFTWRLLQPRPPIELSIARCRHQAWRAFAHHHYLNHRLARAAVCFLATWQGRPVAFSAWLPFLGTGPPARREHRTVTLPDYQGVGIGNALSATIASMWAGLGYRARSTTTHPAMISARCRSGLWLMHRRPSLNRSIEKKYRGLRHAATRLTAGFTYCGPAMPHDEAKARSMADTRHRLTPALGQQICAYIRAGGYPPVAAQAAGVPGKLFKRWLTRGLRKGAREPYRSFAESVRQAEAQARLGAEMAAYKKDAMNWLKSGPGRETTDGPGWSMPVKARAGDERRSNPLLQPEVARLVAALLQALTAFPEARAAAAAVLDAAPATN